MPTCFFIGHREAPDSLLPQLSAAVERHIIELGVTEFVVGSYGWFDSMAARTVRATKKNYPEVTLTLLLHYHPYDRPIPTPDGFDGTFYPPGMAEARVKYRNPGLFRAQFCKKETVPSFISSHT